MTDLRPPLPIRTPADLRALMRADFELSAQQWAAVSAPLEPAVVIAGAGSGKTSLMAARVVHLVATGQVRADEVLGLTFTTKAASELAHRIRGALAAAGLDTAPGDPDDAEAGELGEVAEPVVATYNAYAASLLTEHGLRIGHEPDTRVLADATRYQLAGRVVQQHRGAVELLSDHPETVIGYILALEGQLGEHLVGPDDVRAFQDRERPRFAAALETSRARADLLKVLDTFGRRAELLDLVVAYRALKARLGVMDFSDQIALAARLAEAHPEVGAAERARFKVVLLDEYQDTSVAQARMLGRLFSGPDAASGRGHAVTAVGDPNQAIYGWRGASVSNILGFGRDFPAADGSEQVPVHPLTVNRRSDARILEAANRLADPLLTATPQVRPLEAPPGAAPGRVRVVVHEAYDDELAWLAEEVLATRAAGTPWREVGVLVRDNAHAADVFDALTRREVPVEIVGLSGLLRLPEVAEVVATLRLLHDLTANDALLTLLTGPRWAVGPRDLALLGARARQLAGAVGADDLVQTVADQLSAAVAGADPTEVAALTDALDDPGEAPEHPYSRQARERFALLADELRRLRRHAAEPLLDLVRRIIDTTGIDVELASSTSPAAAARRDNLDLFVRAVADFQSLDGAATLGALLAYLTAEDELGTGLDVAVPTEADSVKLLTVHRAKGLEWDVVHCVGVSEEKFPTKRTRTSWVSGPGVLPTALRGDADDLPRLGGHTKADLDRLREETREHEAAEELRLGYVAFTRPRHELVVSSYVWHPDRATPLGPSPYQQVLREHLAAWGEEPDAWCERPPKDTPNPLRAEPVSAPWPTTERTAEAERRLVAAALVREELARAAGPGADAEEQEPTGDVVTAAVVAEWDAELDRLVAEARADRAPVAALRLPTSISATALTRLHADPEGFAAELARPMPRRPSSAARFGTRFHAWVEARFGQQDLFDPEDLPGQGDSGIDDEEDLAALTAAFEAGAFADRAPHAVEAPFSLVLGGQVVRGRIDAVYRDDDPAVPAAAGAGPRYLVVDWKTGRASGTDPVQLAVYRLAWAELAGVPLEAVRAAFYLVRDGRLVEPDPAALPDRDALTRLLRAPTLPAPAAPGGRPRSG